MTKKRDIWFRIEETRRSRPMMVLADDWAEAERRSKLPNWQQWDIPSQEWEIIVSRRIVPMEIDDEPQ